MRRSARRLFTLGPAVSLLALLTGCVPSGQGPSHAVATGVPVASVSFNAGAGRGALLVVPVRAGSRTLDFAVDTGSSHTCVDVSLTPGLTPLRRAVPLNQWDPSGAVSAAAFRAPPLFLGEHRLNTAGAVLALDLAGIRVATGHDVYGILGIDVLRRYCVDIDFAGSRIELLDRAPGPGEGTSFPIRYNKLGWAYVKVDAVGQTGLPFMIDTGDTSAGTFSTSLIDRAIKLGQVEVFEATVYRLGGTRAVRDAAPKRPITLAGLSHTATTFTEGHVSTIGLEILARYRVRLNFPSRRMYLQPATRGGSDAVRRTRRDLVVKRLQSPGPRG